MGAVAQWILKSFLKGLLLLVPLTVTVWVFYRVIHGVDKLLSLDGLLGRHVPGLGVLATLVIIVVAGALGSFILVDRLVAWLEAAVSRVPVAKLIYFSLKDFVGAFVGEKKGFNRPALVTLDETRGIRVVGFVTADLPELPGGEAVAVYLPYAYSVAGRLILVPRARVTLLPPGESAKWLTFVVSGGVSGNKTPD
jgi:uncharacterized membrane protein